MASTPTRAVRRRAPLKIALMGASGSGKTYSSLLIARGMGERILLLDTEAGSGLLYDDIYVDTFGPDEHYDHIPIEAPYTPQKCNEEVLAHAANYDVIIIDSASKFWSGQGGLLEIKEARARQTGNSWAAWSDVTPIYNKFIDTLIEAPCHIIATLRSRTQWIVEKEGKATPTKVGTEPVAREGIEYEFTTAFTLDHTNTAMASKDRTGIFGQQAFTPSYETGRRFIEWLNRSAPNVARARSAVAGPAPAPDDDDDPRMGDLSGVPDAVPARRRVDDVW